MAGEREWQMPTDPAERERWLQDQGNLRQAWQAAQNGEGGRSGQDESGAHYYIPEGSDTPVFLNTEWTAQDPSKLGRAGGYVGPQDGMYYRADPRNPWSMQDNGSDKPMGQLVERRDERDLGLLGGLLPYAGMAASALLPGLVGPTMGAIGAGAIGGASQAILDSAVPQGRRPTTQQMTADAVRQRAAPTPTPVPAATSDQISRVRDAALAMVQAGRYVPNRS